MRYINNSHIYLQNGIENRPSIRFVQLTFSLLERFACSALLTPGVDSFLFLPNWMTYQSDFYKIKYFAILRVSLWASFNDDEVLCGVTKGKPQELFIRVVRPAVYSSLVHSRVLLSFNLNNGYLIEIGFSQAFSQRSAQETRCESESSRFVGAHKRSRCVRENFLKREKFLTWDVKGKGIF